MNPMSGKTVPTKPIAGLAVILFIATVIGGWLFVDNTRAELEARIEALEARLVLERPSEQPVSDAAGGRVTEPTAINGWRTVVSADGSYQLNLPPGVKLAEGTPSETLKVDYVLSDPMPADGELPWMGIQIAPASEKARYENQGGKLVITKGKLYWLYLYENLNWEPFDVVVNTFEVR